MDIPGCRKISCNRTHINTSEQELTIYMRGKVEHSYGWQLLGCLYSIICFLTFAAIWSIHLGFIVIFILELLIYFSFEIIWHNVKSQYEIWKFNKIDLTMFRFQAPYMKLSNPKINDYATENSLIQSILLSHVEKVNASEYCNDGGYYYSFSLGTGDGSFFMYPPGKDALLLEREIRSWLIKARQDLRKP